jgi:hypothetical protein
MSVLKDNMGKNKPSNLCQKLKNIIWTLAILWKSFKNKLYTLILIRSYDRFFSKRKFHTQYRFRNNRFKSFVFLALNTFRPD